MPDAVVIGAGPNGLVAANLLADAGWSVEVLEAQDEPGGAVRHDRGVDPDFTSDLFSSFYPLAAASPVLAGLRLEREGLEWSHAPKVLAHPLLDGRCAVLSRDPEETAASLEAFAPGDGAAWQELREVWERLRPDILDALFTPFPPLRAGARLALRLRAAGGLRLARTMVLPVRRLGEEEFRGEGGRLLLAGNALHADLAPESAGSGGFGWLMSMLAQTYGFPVPTGGSGALTGALVRRLARRGGSVRCGEQVTEVVVRGGRAVGVRTGSGEEVAARRAVLADVSAPALYGSLVAERHLPGRLLGDLKRFQWDFATFKVDWALNGPVPWACPEAAHAGTVHLAEGVDGLTRFAAQIAMGRVPDRPFALFGQMTTTDPGRSPGGTESAWAYTHVPHRVRGTPGTRGCPVPGTAGSRRSWPTVSRRRSSGTLPGSAASSGHVASSPRRRWRAWTPTSTAARSTAAPRRCTSSWSSAPPRAPAGRRPLSPASTSPQPPRTPVEESTGPPEPTRRGRPCVDGTPAPCPISRTGSPTATAPGGVPDARARPAAPAVVPACSAPVPAHAPRLSEVPRSVPARPRARVCAGRCRSSPSAPPRAPRDMPRRSPRSER